MPVTDAAARDPARASRATGLAMVLLLALLMLLIVAGSGLALLWFSNQPLHLAGYVVLGPNCGYGARVQAETNQAVRVQQAMLLGRREPRAWSAGPYTVFPP